MKHLVQTMKALSDPSRLKIMKLLESREALCVCELTAALGLSQPTVSKHLRLLEGAGLVESERAGAWVNYRLPRSPEAPYAAELLPLLRQWLNDDPQIDALLSHISGISRESLCQKA